MERKFFLLIVVALLVFLIGSVLLIEDKFLNLVNKIIPDRSVISVYVEKGSL